YLNNTPSSTQTDEQVVQLTTALGAWSLTKAEKLQMINIRPRQIVEIHMLIEECDERFDMEALETMLATVRQHLPRDDDNEEEEEEEDGENTDNNMAEDANGDSHNDDVAMNDV
ncbi:RNA polymerase Rpb4-domain-containing protein, partial [Syncephalis fuscata]